MKNVLLLFVAGVVLLSPTAAFAVKASEIYEWCTDYPDGGRPALCRVYTGAIMEFFESDSDPLDNETRVCLPHDATVDQIIPIIYHWLDKNPEERQLRAGVAAGHALAPVYPCAPQ